MVPNEPDSISEPTAEAGAEVSNLLDAVRVHNALQAAVVNGGVHFHAATEREVPCCLPPPPPPVVGRVRELEILDETLAATAQEVGAQPDGHRMAIFAISGSGGIGKTSLALHWAHRNAHRFPDGQLFVDLHGFSDPTHEHVDPLSAVRGFLDALGVDTARVSGDLAVHAARYRNKVAGKRMLIVLDNAATIDQITPLLPSTDTCAVLVTSRKKLTTLITHYGAGHLQLHPLDHDVACALLTERLSPAGVAAEPELVDELVRLCGRYPLALAIIAARDRMRPHIPLAELATELRNLGLDALDNPDPVASVPAVLSSSLRHLTRDQRRLFALLGIAPGPDITLPAAASLIDRSLTRTRIALQALEDASLLERQAPDRYAMHDLIRSYAATVARHGLIKFRRTAALRRIVDFYLDTARTAHHLLFPQVRPLWLWSEVEKPVFVRRPHPLADLQMALAWLDAEHANLMAAQRAAVVQGWHDRVWHLALALRWFMFHRGHRQDALITSRAAVRATEHLPDPIDHSVAQRCLGNDCSRLGLHEEAIEHLRAALAWAERYHDPHEQTYAHEDLAACWERRGDYQRALGHAERALTLLRTHKYRTGADPAQQARILGLVGWYTAHLGDYDTALVKCQDSLAMYRDRSVHIGEEDTLTSLGFINHHTGHHLAAIEHYRQALTLLRDNGDIFTAADTLDLLGHPHVALGHHDEARAVWREALELYRHLGRDADADRVQRQFDALDQQG